MAEQPVDPVGDAILAFVGELLGNADVVMAYTADSEPAPGDVCDQSASVITSASASLVPGWTTTLSIGFGARSVAQVAAVPDAFIGLPHAALRAASRFAGKRHSALTPAEQRALRDDIIIELLSGQDDVKEQTADDVSAPTRLIAETVEYLIELSGTRVEAHNLTHGVIITDAISHEPRLEVKYPSGLRDAKRSPLLFDGQRSVLLVDQSGRARTELQSHQLDRLHPSSRPLEPVDHEFVESGSLVAQATRQLGGIGFFLREDRSIWVFLDGQPLVIRRGEHWSAFPLWLARAIGGAIGGGAAVDLIVGAALMVSMKTGGAIFAIVDDAAAVDDIVARKDRYDLRDQIAADDMRPETKLHHLIDARRLDEQTLARLSELDGATILDRTGALLAYGAIVTSADSQQEGARTAAAKSLSTRALVVLKVSEDGDITVFSDGESIATLLPSSGNR